MSNRYYFEVDVVATVMIVADDIEEAKSVIGEYTEYEVLEDCHAEITGKRLVEID